MAITTLPKARTALAYAAGSAAAILIGAFIPIRTINADPASAHVNVRPAPIEVVAEPTPAPAEPTAVLIPAACATSNPDLYPCPAGTEQAMGVRW